MKLRDDSLGPLGERPLPLPLPRPHDVVHRQRIRERRPRLRGPRTDRLEGRPRLCPRGALDPAGALPARRRNLGRPVSARPRHGRLEHRQRAHAGRDRRPPPLRQRRGVAPDGARRAQRPELRVLPPGGRRDRPGDRPEADAPVRRTRSSASVQRDRDRRRRARRPRRRCDEPGGRDRRRRGLILPGRSVSRPRPPPDEPSPGSVELHGRAGHRLARVHLPHVAVGDRPPVRLRQRDPVRSRRRARAARSPRTISAVRQRGGSSSLRKHSVSSRVA